MQHMATRKEHVAPSGLASLHPAQGDQVMSKKNSSKGSKKKTKAKGSAKAAKTKGVAATKPETKAPATKPPRASGLNAAAQVLKDAGKPMRCKDMVEKMLSDGLWKTEGKTPAATIYS